jgi:hypothetical protein
MSIPVSVLDPIIRLKTADGTRQGGLHDLLALIADGSLIDLPGMRADQRAPVATGLAILLHLLRRYEARMPTDPAGWARALRSQLGNEALVLAGGPTRDPAFLQPAFENFVKSEPLSIADLDHLMPATRHVLKGQESVSPEEAFYALLASTWRQHAGRGHYAGARARLLVVLVGDGTTLASEIASLAAAYDGMKPVVAGSEAAPAKSAADHMLWLKPWRDGEPFSRVPYPFIDCRHVRLVQREDGRLGAAFVSGTDMRVDTGAGDLEDPHVPVQTSGAPYKLAKKRSWSHEVQHAALVGSETVRRPHILDLAPAYAWVRISGIGYDQGVTKGYWEALYRIARGQPRRLISSGPTDRLSDLSARSLAVVREAGRVMYPPLLELGNNYAAPAKRSIGRLRRLIGPQSLQLILDLVGDEPDAAREQKAMHEMAVAGIRQVWGEAISAIVGPLRAARATLHLDWRVYTTFQEHVMAEMPGTDLGRRTAAVLYAIDSHLTPSSRARIRSSATELPLDAYIAMAAAPASETNDPGARRVWEAAIRALSVVHQGGATVGAVLAETEYPENRVSTLLAATGDALQNLIDEAVRWIVSHDVRSANLTDLIVMGLADALGDRLTLKDAATRLALAYARALPSHRASAA